MSKKPEKPKVDTTGHNWDGIKELNNPLPRWWLYCFYLTIVWGIGYTIAYPAWPLVSGATNGVLGFSTRVNVAEDIQRYEVANAGVSAELAAADLMICRVMVVRTCCKAMAVAIRCRAAAVATRWKVA